nr:GtrA family protein [Flexivirga aerilata]
MERVLVQRIQTLVRSVWREAAKFGVIGVLNTFVDIGLFNLLVDGPMNDKVTTAKIISGGVATVLAWIGNRYWTFRHRRNRPVHHEVVLFFVVNGIALGISALWVAFAHYTLDMRGTLWLNVNAFIGIGLGTIFRFWAYKKYVFANEPIDSEPATEALTEPLQDTAEPGQRQRHSA